MKVLCKYLFNTTNQYECRAFKVVITQRCEIESFVGEHIKGRSGSDVDILGFDDSTVLYVPGGLPKFFPNLKALEIRRCSLKEINAEDLHGLSSLTNLSVGNNCLKSLPNDLFMHTKRLRRISFEWNELEFLSSRLLNTIPDHQWDLVDFRKNSKIDQIYWPITGKGLKSIHQMKVAIDSSCFPTAAKSISMNYRKLWEDKKYTDFTILADGKEFSVHKNVLAVQCPFFASLLKTDDKVKASNKYEITVSGYEVVEDFLYCLYTGEIKRVGHSVELFNLAATFNDEELKKEFELIACTNINNDNALKALFIGNAHESVKIIESAFNILKKVLPNDALSDLLKFKPNEVGEILKNKSLIAKLNKH